jgi:hypothetical protein
LNLSTSLERLLNRSRGTSPVRPQLHLSDQRQRAHVAATIPKTCSVCFSSEYFPPD